MTKQRCSNCGGGKILDGPCYNSTQELYGTTVCEMLSQAYKRGKEDAAAQSSDNEFSADKIRWCGKWYYPQPSLPSDEEIEVKARKHCERDYNFDHYGLTLKRFISGAHWMRDEIVGARDYKGGEG